MLSDYNDDDVCVSDNDHVCADCTRRVLESGISLSEVVTMIYHASVILTSVFLVNEIFPSSSLFHESSTFRVLGIVSCCFEVSANVSGTLTYPFSNNFYHLSFLEIYSFNHAFYVVAEIN